MARFPTDADEVHFAPTPDGWRLALHRHRPRSGGPGLPVVLCGGYACNRHFMDYDERYSLARYLARQGFDAWVLELRGRGLSHPTRECRHPWGWTFDDLAAIDVPAAIAHVAVTTERPIAWVGHSMGGMLLYAHLGTHAGAARPLVAGVTIAAPVVFPATSSELFQRIGTMLLRVPLSDTIHQRWVLGALWGLLGHSSALGVGMNPDNVDRAVVGRALHRSLSNVPRVKLQQLADWALEGVFASVDRRVDYRAALAHVATPLLLVAGSVDRLATPAAVQRALEHLPAPTASYLEFGRAHGHSTEYGHVDLVLGRAAPGEVFPTIARWLAERGEPPPA
jgi:predicted alpha/beta hydrolase